MSLEQQVANLVEASNNLTGTVNTKISEIDHEVEEAKKEMDQFVANSKGYFVNQFSIGHVGSAVRIWKLGRLDFQNSPDGYSGEQGYIELMLLNGRDYGDQGTRTTHFSASFRENFNASHYFAGSYNPDPGRYCHFVIAHDAGNTRGYYYLYLIQCQYAVCTVVNLHETTPMSPDFSEKEILKTFGNSSLSTLDWDVDIIKFIEQTDNVSCVYTTRDEANAILTVGKLRYSEIEQITPPA